jgi:hypothetical protein
MIRQETQVEVEISGRKQRYCCDPSSSFSEIWQGIQAIVDELKACESRTIEQQQKAQETAIADESLKESTNG